MTSPKWTAAHEAALERTRDTITLELDDAPAPVLSAETIRRAEELRRQRCEEAQAQRQRAKQRRASGQPTATTDGVDR